MIDEILKSAGMSKNEAKIYVALIELGPCGITELCSKTKIHRRNIYDSLESLTGKGFVFATMLNKHNAYEAANPKTILDVLEEKKRSIESILPKLLAKQKHPKTAVQVYTGQSGRRIIFEDKLNYKGEQYVLGAHEPSTRSALYNEGYHKRRIQKKIHLKMLFIHNDLAAAKRYRKYGFVSVRLLPKEFDSPIAINIYANKVAILLGSGTIEPLSILIEDKSLAKEFKEYFNALWRLSKPIRN